MPKYFQVYFSRTEQTNAKEAIVTMLHTPYQIIMASREFDQPVGMRRPEPARWTWIAGRRYRAEKRS
ncbi:MAG: hypothetical protein JWN72_364 [Thermoleophilia bacterium]|nr:hypothetical protein [Thermoleophilia bacterium]